MSDNVLLTKKPLITEVFLFMVVQIYFTTFLTKAARVGLPS